ncbi:RNA polymerase III subunit C53 isoform X2 [Lycorma delicatula]|uniref:RNA polymerase III subunit C53 isoform X2 n=1 Tax=Lycorma delicatula TaxID=130591 RepID=UPI003F5158E3
MQGSKDLMNGTAIKAEPGTSTQRLPSLRGPRDLSLSPFSTKLLPNVNQDQAKNKKIYLPNVNVKRNRQRENCVVKQEPKENKVKPNIPEKGRGAGKKNRTIIQLNPGPFSECFSQGTKSSRYGRYNSGSDGRSEKPTLQKQRLTKQENIKIDKNEEDMMLKELLRDDFVDDPNLEPDYENYPVKLPLHEGNIFIKNNLKSMKTEADTVDGDNILSGEIRIKTEPGLDLNNSGEIIRIKTEPGLEDDIQGKLTEIKLNIDTKIPSDDKKPRLPTVKDLMNSEEPQFVMLQLPTCMPGLKPEDSNVRQDVASSSQNNGAGTSATSSSSTEQRSTKSESELRCTLQTLKPGKIGKMQVLKSGRIRLILGDTKLWLEMGTQVSFKQDLISVDLDRNTKKGSTICMGSVPLRMTVTPDWEQMVSSQTVF